MADGVPMASSRSTLSNLDHQALAELLESAARVAYAAAAAEDALQWAVDHVCAFTGWPIGHVFLVDDYEGGVVSSRIWHLDDAEAYGPFVEETSLIRFKVGEGLPGRVLESQQPAWIVDVREDDNFPRRVSAKECGVAAAFAFPITTPDGIVGVLEFFSQDPADPEPVFLRLIANIGEAVGHVMCQLQARDALAASEARLAEAQRLAKLGSWSWSIGFDEVHWSDELYRIYGIEKVDAPPTFDAYLAHVHPDDIELVTAAIDAAVTAGDPYEHEYRIVREDGTERWVSARGEVVQRRNGIPERLVGYCQDITEQKRAHAERQRLTADLLDQRRILERIARGEPLEAVVHDLCLIFESRYPGARCSVLRVDAGGDVLHHVAGPSLPQEVRDVIDGLAVAEGNGACGTAAARDETVVVVDTLTDPLTAGFTAIAEAHALRSIWSMPLHDTDGTVTGTFAVYRSERHEPDAEERASLDVARHLAEIAIERQRTEDAR